MPAPAAPENGPAPTPARAVYGFLLHVASVLAAGVYLTWALVPPHWLRAIGLDYWPQQLWALTVPAALLSALLLFFLVIYPLLGLLDAPGLDEPRVHTDEHSLPARPAAPGGIPPVCDIPLSQVCRHLYMDSGEDDDWGEEAAPADGRWRREDRPARRQNGRHLAWDEPRRRGWSERDARWRDERGHGLGDVRWVGGAEPWRARQRRRDETGGFSPGVDS